MFSLILHQKGKGSWNLSYVNIVPRQGMCKTRWVERHACIETFFELYEFVPICVDAMLLPSDYPAVHHHDWSWDADTKTKANGLKSSL